MSQRVWWALSPRDCQAHLLVRGHQPGVPTARCGEVVPTVAIQFSDRPCESLLCPACAGTDGGGPVSGSPPELPPTPGGQPVPSCGSATSRPVSGAQLGPVLAPRVARARWGRCPTDQRLHYLDLSAVREVAEVGWAQACCGRLIFVEGLTLRGGTAGLCVRCRDAGKAP
ncbi:MAG: hypothetical protein JO115_00020 [Pseudonocardiales bacterium]|nr:hypothetical protein [Pseudonocardiales bacterium]